jgi:hypothetical protein
MRGVVAAALSVIALVPVSTHPIRDRAQDADVFAKRGVYVETERGVFELRSYVEAKSLSDVPEIKAYRYVIPPTLDVPRARVVLSFVINMPGNQAEPWVAATQLAFLAGREIEEGRSGNYVPLTARISRLRPSVYLIQSPQFDLTWIKETYGRLAAREDRKEPEGFMALMVQDANGQPRKLYPVQLFGH